MIRKVISNIPVHKAPSPPSTTSWVFDDVNLLPNVTPTSDIVEVLTASNITLEDSGGQDIPPEPEDVILRITLYSIIFVFAVVGNVLVLVTLVQNKRMRTVTNVFLVNLAVSDLLLGVLCMPFTLVGSLLRNFVFGEIMCRLIPYLQAVSVSVSVWTLVSISLERFFAIVRPLQSRRWQTISHAYRVIGIIWALSLAHVAPIALLSQLIPMRMPGRHKCRELWPSDVAEKGFNLYLDSVLLVLPLLIMVFVYALITRTLYAGIRMEHRSIALGIPMKAVYREKANGFQCTAAKPMVHTGTATRIANGFGRGTVLVRGGNPEKNQSAMVRVIRMLFVVVVEFFVCWTPLYVVNTWSLYDPKSVYDTLGPTGVSVVQLLAYASSCSNPITYCFMHQKFREGFLTAAGCREGCGRGEAGASRRSSAKSNFASGASGTTLNYMGSQRKAQKEPDADSTTVQTPCKDAGEESSA